MNEIIIPYTPRPAQLELHRKLKRWSVIVWHRRAGKTVWAVNQLIKSAIECNLKNPQFAYIAPTYSQVKRVAWNYIKEYTAPIPGVTYNEAELRCDFMGRRIYLLGADNYHNLRGIYLDGAVLDEFGDMKPDAWAEVIRPALSDRKGWAVRMGTPRGRNHLWKALEDAKSREDVFDSILRASESGIIDEEELADARLSMTAAKYAKEYECSFDDAENALFKREHIVYKEDLPDMVRIVVAVDPAVTSNTNSDETGIVVCGKGADGHFYVLDDGSGKYTPDGTVKKACRMYEEHEADAIVIEVNNGGDYLSSMFHNFNKNVKVVQVRATRGKAIRAEPISALYENKRVFHAKYMAELEDQLATWEPGEDSPDRLDATVWGITELMGSNQGGGFITI